MSIILPKGLPAIETLRSEGFDARDEIQTGSQSLRILFLNIMPQKAVTELDFARALGGTPLCVELLPMKIKGQTYKTTPMEYMEAFYRDFETFEADCFDGLIVTGAPVEQYPFEDVRYWKQLQHIFDWAKTHVRSTLYVCWGAQAGLYHHYGIPKYWLPEKKFGIYRQKKCRTDVPLLRDMPNPFPMPTSRHTEVKSEDFPTDTDLQIVAESDESGFAMAIANGGKEIYTVGHLEYEPMTLDKEYRRDLAKGLPIASPVHYYKKGGDETAVDFSWEQPAKQFYRNWLTYYVKP